MTVVTPPNSLWCAAELRLLRYSFKTSEKYAGVLLKSKARFKVWLFKTDIK